MPAIIRSAATGVLRDAHWVWTNRNRWESGILLEPARTNELLRSQEFDNASWTKAGGSITQPNLIAAPDGTVTADLFGEDTSTGGHGVVQAYTGTASASQALSVYAKADGRAWISLILDDGTSTNRATAYFDVLNGTVGTVSTAGTASGAVAWITRADNGWWRCHLVAVPHTGGTSFTARILGATANGTNSYTGTSVNVAHLWGAQAENNVTFPTSYIATTSAPVARNADSWSYSLTGTPAATPQPLTLYSRVVLLAPWSQIATFTYPTLLSTSGSVGQVGIGKRGATAWGGYVQINGSVTSSPAGLDVTGAAAGDVLECAAQLSAGGALTTICARNHGAASTTSGAAGGLPTAWTNTNLGYGSGIAAFLTTHALILPGARSLADCRAAAGVV